jgi:perosamine synthetase
VNDRPAILGGEPVRAVLPAWPPRDPDVDRVFGELLATGAWGRYHGPHTEALVRRIVAECGVAHAILCASGTAAVEYALRGVGVGAGDEVILAAYDFRANFRNVLALGAVPVLVDVHAGDYRIDVGELDAAWSERTRAVLVSHLHGGVVEMPAVAEWAGRRNVAVVEDACQVAGARVAGRPAGSGGDVGVHSFGGSKLLTAGRGGAVVTDRDDVAQRIRLHDERGNSLSPLSEMQAAVLRPQWESLAERNRRRGENVDRLRRLLGEREGLIPFGEPVVADSLPAFYKLGFRYVTEAFDGLPREAFCAVMRAEGVPLDPGFRGLHLVHGRRRFRAAGALERATAADGEVVVLHHPFLLEPAEAMADFVRALDKVRGAATMIRQTWGGRT